MKGKLIVDGNAVYLIDEECVRKKRRDAAGEKERSVSRETVKERNKRK